MKKTLISASVCAVLVATPAHADWLETIKGWFGGSQETSITASQTVESAKELASGIDLGGLVNSLSSNLGVTEAQAEGGLGALMNYAKTMNPEQFGALSGKVPGLDGLLGAVPDVANLAGEGGLGGMLSQAAQYSDSLKAMNDLKQQFEALGLDVGMIPQYIDQAKTYLDTPQGQQVKTMLTDSFAKWMG